MPNDQTILDTAMAELEADAVVDVAKVASVATVTTVANTASAPAPASVNDRTTAGMGVTTPRPPPGTAVVTSRPAAPHLPGLSLLQPGKGTIPLEKEHAAVLRQA